MTVEARKSQNRKYIICGACGRSLCQRNRQEWLGLRAGDVVRHVLSWEDGWYRVDDHIEMSGSALERLSAGNKPRRRDWADAARLDLSKFLRTYPPAMCPDCGAINLIKPKRLDVDGIASHS